MEHSVTRRRAIGITAAAAGLALVPLGGAARAEANLVTWRGHAMGAVASLQVHHKDRSAAERLVRRASLRFGGWSRSLASTATT